MNTKFTSLCATLILSAATCLFAAEPEKTKAGEPDKAKAGSPEFERMKTLVGTWTGKTDMGQGPVEMKVEYRVIAGGSVLEERIAPGTPMEMVSMYYDKAGKLAMTHYCVLGNRPEMALKASDAKSITFDLDAACCAFDTKKESHMHGITIKFDDANTITTSCKAVMNGKEESGHETVLKRVKK
jgi:hypothetical protein